MNYDHLKSATTSSPEPQSSLMSDGKALMWIDRIQQLISRIDSRI